MKHFTLITLLSAFAFAGTVYTTEFHSKNYNLLLKGKWDSDILEFCEEDSVTKREELNCKIDTSDTKVTFKRIKDK